MFGWHNQSLGQLSLEGRVLEGVALPRLRVPRQLQIICYETVSDPPYRQLQLGMRTLTGIWP